jgi:hypothetical protein
VVTWQWPSGSESPELALANTLDSPAFIRLMIVVVVLLLLHDIAVRQMTLGIYHQMKLDKNDKGSPQVVNLCFSLSLSVCDFFFP